MNKLIIIGARGFGREVYHLATQCAGYMHDYEVDGFLDDKADALAGFAGYPPILGPVETYTVKKNDIFVCALGDVKWRQHYVKIIREAGGRFQSLVHPEAVLSPNTTIGMGCVILAYAYISCDVTIGDFAVLQPFAAVGHDAKIGSFSHLNAYAFMGGGALLEEGVTLHTGAKVLPHKKVGAWATVGAGSVVLRNVKPGITVFGAPAMSIM